VIRIGVISDTHMGQPTQELRALLQGSFKEVETILHAGDLTELAVLEAFDGKNILAVCGNMDSPAARKQLPTHRVFRAGKFTIGLIHGWGGPQGIEGRIAKEFENVDCIVYGHTHTPLQREMEEIVFFNPGSFGGRRGGSPRSVGILTLGEAISGQIIYL
jgi:putative phosphoesterase